jgi:hypothetical protein
MRKYFLYVGLCLFARLHAAEYDEALEHVKKREYSLAAVHFQQAIDKRDHAPEALFGKALCHAALQQFDEIEKGLAQIDRVMDGKCDPNAINPPTTIPQQRAAYMCRQKVRKLSQKTRATVENLVRTTVPGFWAKIKAYRQLFPYIDALERNSLFCCGNQQTPECCMEPLAEQLKVWNSQGLLLDLDNE